MDFFAECEEWLIDRESDSKPDVYHQNKFRIIDSVLLTNNSSLPVTIIEFSISGIPDHLNAFTMIGDNYSVTVKSMYDELPHGIRAYSGKSLKKVLIYQNFLRCHYLLPFHRMSQKLLRWFLDTMNL